MNDKSKKIGDLQVKIGSYQGSDVRKAYRPAVDQNPQTLNPPQSGSNVMPPAQTQQPTASGSTDQVPAQQPQAAPSDSSEGQTS